MITLSQAQTLLERYKGANNSFAERINLVTERLFKAGNWRSTKDTVLFAIHLDEFERAFITLPWQYDTVLGGVYLRGNEDQQTMARCGLPISVRDEWYSYLQTGPGLQERGWFNWGNGFIPEVDRFTTFRDWHEPKFLRLKFATAEANGLVFNIRGNLDGQPVYTGAGAAMIEGENLTTAGATTLTTTSQFDEIPYALFKPVTYGPVRMYTWDGATETLVAIYAPGETVPQWRRYRVPACSDWTEADPGFALAVCKREWQPIANGNDPVIPGNIGAIRYGLQALLQEDAVDFERAEDLWQKGFKLLANEVEDDTGAGTGTPVQVVDSFMLNQGLAGYGGYWGDGWGANYG